MTSPIERFRGFPPGRRHLLELELLVVTVLIVVALLVGHSRGVGEVIGVAALGYAVGLAAHIALVLLGWPHGGRRGPNAR